ncbi:uncharacterized protein METZ01_LOCUS447741, partial [marine metagenome]
SFRLGPDSAILKFLTVRIYNINKINAHDVIERV